MEERSGSYRFEPPANIPGGLIVVPNATWLECENCGEQLLPAALDNALQEQSIKRQGLLLPAEIKAIREKSVSYRGSIEHAADLGIELRHDFFGRVCRCCHPYQPFTSKSGGCRRSPAVRERSRAPACP